MRYAHVRSDASPRHDDRRVITRIRISCVASSASDGRQAIRSASR